MNPRIRQHLHDAIFAVMDEIESRSGGQPDHPTVVQLRIALNLVKDDLGWNEVSPSIAADPSEKGDQ